MNRRWNSFHRWSFRSRMIRNLWKHSQCLGHAVIFEIFYLNHTSWSNRSGIIEILSPQILITILHLTPNSPQPCSYLLFLLFKVRVYSVFPKFLETSCRFWTQEIFFSLCTFLFQKGSKDKDIFVKISHVRVPYEIGKTFTSSHTCSGDIRYTPYNTSGFEAISEWMAPMCMCSVLLNNFFCMGYFETTIVRASRQYLTFFL